MDVYDLDHEEIRYDRGDPRQGSGGNMQLQHKLGQVTAEKQALEGLLEEVCNSRICFEKFRYGCSMYNTIMYTFMCRYVDVDVFVFVCVAISFPIL